MRFIRYASAMLLMVILLSNSSSSLFEKQNDGLLAIAASSESINEITTLKPVELYREWDLESSGLSLAAFEMAHKGFSLLEAGNRLHNANLLTIIDYSMPSSQKRLFVLEMVTGKIIFNSLVAHGRNSGYNYATAFSNRSESHQSSLGFFITLNSYVGENGYSLKLQGCESGINDKAYRRAIVLHGADYVSESFIQRNGYLGRSHGCPAVPVSLSKKIIDVIKGGSCMFLYYPSKKYIQRSKILNS